MPLPPSATHQVVNPSSTSAPSSTGLTALHIAVITNNRGEVRALLNSKEHAVDERTPTGATALMLASLYGRSSIFIYLLQKSASLSKQDYEGFDCMDYVKHLPFTKPLLEKWELEAVAVENPRRSGRKFIYHFVRPFSSIAKQGRLRATTVENPPTQDSAAQTVPAKVVPSQILPQLPPQASGEESERRIDFLRRGGVLEIIESRSLALVEWPFKLKRKTCAAIRGSGEAAYRAIAVSGWRGHEVVQFVNVAECLNNATYLELTREFAAVVGYKFKKNWLDDRWSSTPEKAGVFHACHAEKQVAIFILRESMAHVSGTRDITLENMAALKLAQGLQKEFIIEIEHKPCNCCIRFLKLIYKNSGLSFKWVQRQWFTEGKRSRLKRHSGLQDSPEADGSDEYEDEIDDGDSDGDLQLVPDNAPKTAATARPEEDSDDWVVAMARGRPRRRERRQFDLPTKAGSEVGEDDFPPARKNIEKLMVLTSSQEKKQNGRQMQKRRRRQMRKKEQKSVVQTQLLRNFGTPGTSGQSTEGAVTPIHFEIPIRRIARPVAEPFPGASEWAKSFDSEEIE